MRRLARLILAVIVTVGLLTAPLGASAMMTATAPQMAMSQDMDMSGPMPCCPDQEKSKDCANCPLMALCSAGVVFMAPLADSSYLRSSYTSAFASGDDLHLEGLGARPPDHPPRLLV